MCKLKTNSSVKKRFKLSGSGKLIRTISGKRHGMRFRSGRSKARESMVVMDKSDQTRIMSMLPYKLR